MTETLQKQFVHSNATLGDEGHLHFAGVDTVRMAEKYGTPLMLLDEDRVRARCREYKEAMARYLAPGSMPLFASKALSFRGIYRIMADEGMATDIVSPGELYTAVSAGFPMERAYFHGNNKTDEDIRYAIKCGIGYFIVDNAEELERVNAEASSAGIVQKILLRITPGIDPHTHAKINTGRVDSKFGSAIETGAAFAITRAALAKENLELHGFHCHIGSQIFDTEPFTDAADIMIGFIAEVRNRLGYTADTLNLGGGFGVRYTDDDPEIDIAKNIMLIAEHIKRDCESAGLPQPRILLEPGRSLVADAGMTVYTVGGVKEIEGFRSYVSVDGGMTDNPRYTLYQSRYTALLANRAGEAADFECTVGGRCCESGDLLGEGLRMPRPRRGDLLAVLVTGAYNYSMASNYNRVCRPPVVILRGGEDRVGVRRETFEDLTACDM